MNGITAVRWTGAGLVALGTLKYLAITAEYDWNVAQSPWIFLLVLAGLPALGLASSRGGRRAGVILLGVVHVLWAGIMGAALVTGATLEHWSDAVVVYVGTPVALLGIVAVVAALRSATASRAVPGRAQ